MSHKKKIIRAFVRQMDSVDCGPACLLTLIRYYGGNCTMQRIRANAGTGHDGTTLYGLLQAASHTGFDAEGCEGSIEDLIALNEPVILHTVTETHRSHYVVCYGRDDDRFLVSDPAQGIRSVSTADLAVMWASRKCLVLRPGANFVSATRLNREKLKWIVELIRKDYPVLVISIVLGIVIAVLGIVMAAFTQQLVDKILPSNDAALLLRAVALVFLLLAIHLTFASVRKFLILFQSQGFNKRIITAFYDSLLELPKPFFDSHKIGDMVARLNDTGRIQKIVTLILGGIVIDTLAILAALSVLYFYSPKVGLITTFFLPLYGFITYYYNDRITDAQRRMMDAYAESESNFINTLLGIGTIKNRNKQGIFSALNQSVYGSFQQRVVDLGVINIKLGAFSGFLGIAFLTWIITVMGLDVLNGGMTAGRMIGVIGMAGILLPAVSNLSLVSIPIKEARVALDRMFEFLHAGPGDSSRSMRSVETLESLSIRDLSFGFPGRKRILNEVSFDVHRGEIVSITGDSGCGKSTLLQILQKFYNPDAGDVLVNGSICFRNVDPVCWNNLIGVVPQEIHLFNGSVVFNIALSLVPDEAAHAIDVCRTYGFDRFITTLPQGYQTVIGEDGINLSGGQKQIIGLARALVHNPQLLILDEATSALDSETERFVSAIVQSLAKTIAVVLVSHRLSLLKNLSNRIYALEKGRLHQIGPKDLPWV